MALSGIQVRIAFVGRLAEQVAATITRVRPVMAEGLRDILADIFRRSQARVSGPVLRVRTGLLRSSAYMRAAETPTGVEGAIGYKAIYAKFHEFGTRPYTIRPRTKTTLRFMGRNGRAVFAKMVRHPGLRPRPFLGPSMEEVRPTVQPRLTQLIIQAVNEAGR